jgi:hypothetical protein
MLCSPLLRSITSTLTSRFQAPPPRSACWFSWWCDIDHSGMASEALEVLATKGTAKKEDMENVTRSKCLGLELSEPFARGGGTDRATLKTNQRLDGCCPPLFAPYVVPLAHPAAPSRLELFCR